MAELTMNLPTAIILLLIAALVFLAIRRVHTRGMCDCKDGCGGGGDCCNAVNKMLANMEEATKQN